MIVSWYEVLYEFHHMNDCISKSWFAFKPDYYLSRFLVITICVFQIFQVVYKFFLTSIIITLITIIDCNIGINAAKGYYNL